MRTRVFTFGLTLIASVAVAQDGPAPILVAPTVPPAFRLLDEPAVQKDIGLTGTQKTAAEQIQLSWPLAANGLRLGRFGYVPPDVMRAAINQRTADFLAKALTKEQRTRLDQIVFQLREKEFGAHQAFAMAARDLGLRPDQVEDVRTLKALRVEEIASEVASGKRFEKVKAEVQATNGDTYEKMAEMLSRAQRERLKEMRGRPLPAGLVPVTPAPSVVPAPKEPVDEPPMPELAPEPRVIIREVSLPAGYKLILDRYPSELFGVYDLELRYLDSWVVQGELKVTLEQSRKLELALRAWSKAHLALPGLDLNRAGRLHDQTANAINEILTPQQRIRFFEIMMQRRALVGPEAMCGHPAAVEALKLTPNQLQQLREGKSIDSVLTAEQKAARKSLLGKPFTLPTNVVDPLLGRELVPSSSPELVAIQPTSRAPEVPYAVARDFLILTNRLKLTAEQVKKLRDLAEDEPKVRELIQKELDLDDTPPVAGAGRGQTAVNVVTEHYRAAVEQQCWDVLEPGQQSIARKVFGRVAK
jgi:hypothetical protein